MIRTFCIAALLSCGIAIGQPPPAPQTTAQTQAFEIVSIRPSKPGSPWGSAQILPDGLRANGVGLWQSLAMAYFPMKLYSPDRIQGEPSWTRDQYDIEAKVAPADVAKWQKQAPQNLMLQAMLQQMLADRCKLAVHRIPASIAGYALVVAKSGPKLKPTPPDEIFPTGYIPSDNGLVTGYRPGGKIEVTFRGTSMEGFASHLSGMSFQHPVLNQTGLAGRFDFVLAYRSMDPAADPSVVIVTPTGENPLASWDVKALGLQLDPIKIPTETIVIDHIEKPTQK